MSALTAASAPSQQTISIEFSTSSGSIGGAFVKASVVAGKIFALWRAEGPGGKYSACSMDIGHVRLKATVALPEGQKDNLEVVHYLMGKTWNWYEGTAGVLFVDSEADFDKAVKA